MAPPGPVKIGHKKDGRQRRPHRFHVSRPPPYPAAGSATGSYIVFMSSNCSNETTNLTMHRPILITIVVDKEHQKSVVLQEYYDMI